MTRQRKIPDVRAAGRRGGLRAPSLPAAKLSSPKLPSPGLPSRGVPTVAKRAALFGTAAGVVAAGAAVGLAAERYAIGRSFRRSNEAAEPFGELRGEPLTVTADDGVELHVEVVQAPGAPDVTVVFCHGLALDLTTWHYQFRDLQDVGRLVFWDQRGHGHSGRGIPEHANIDQLGSDLLRVIEATDDDRPVVLIGHSMGGMSIMAVADQHPELFGDRIIGVGLIATSPGMLADVTLGVPAAAGRLLRRVAPKALNTLNRWPEFVERARRAGHDIQFVVTKRYSFATDVSPWLVQFVARMHEDTPLDVLAELYPAFDAHDKLAALDVLKGVETLILCGEKDLMTPADHSRGMAETVGGAELVVLPDAAHMLMLEHHDAVNAHIRALVERALRARAVA